MRVGADPAAAPVVRCTTATRRARGSPAITPSDSIRNVALFTIEGELDDISGSGQTQAAHDLCRGIPQANRRHLTAIGVGHYGIFSGRRWREMISPQIAQFIRAHDSSG